jgi:N-alpha-acetyltransferase 15/16, NatA auxiliary subunit
MRSERHGTPRPLPRLIDFEREMSSAVEAAPQLPPKDASTFKLLLQSYESKNYKKSLKLSSDLLSKHPSHGPSLALRALTIHSLPKSQWSQHCATDKDPTKMSRRAIKLDSKSSLCWHVLGLIYRSEKKWEESEKCYNQAVKLDQVRTPFFQPLKVNFD